MRFCQLKANGQPFRFSDRQPHFTVKKQSQNDSKLSLNTLIKI
jgi:hypothetical protein